MKSITRPSRFLRILFLCCLLICVFSSSGQNITRIEYFVNTDPGFGNGINVPIGASSDVTAAFQVNINSLPVGFHNLFVRSYVTPYQVTVDSQLVKRGGWSLSVQKVFYKEVFDVASPIPNIVAGEYFADVDPGFGRGTNIPITSGTDLTNVAFAFDITNLPDGFHNLFVRFRDANNKWGISIVKTFYKETLPPGGNILPNISKGEYFIDTDPGVGNGIPIPVTPASDISNITFAANLSTATVGFHQLLVRFKDANG